MSKKPYQPKMKASTGKYCYVVAIILKGEVDWEVYTSHLKAHERMYDLGFGTVALLQRVIH